MSHTISSTLIDQRCSIADESVTADADNPRNTVPRNGNQSITTANTVDNDVRFEDFNQESTTTGMLDRTVHHLNVVWDISL